MDDDTTTQSTDIWASPPKDDAPPRERPKTPRTPKTPSNQKDEFDHEAALRRELEGVRSINAAIEGVIGTLERAKGNMNVRKRIVFRRTRSVLPELATHL
jgi:hypothetical protein